ncbi:uncharacterized protein TRUGW13939_02922 [Talaromyces rugulosus]|uniref:Uncharacterized protein n=1 Tax=Talaromyces rugulosus TaxID=121627 RepID=A0A7H8QPE1_TALRU|nr:uncharacterized protein TRUGW13939_02922 [Talaromyces rugulosus]QKX55824.1 hypothetical protein TRUGW13939_02922 [Talaromyces rugulosus]
MIVRLVSGSFLPDHNGVPVILFSFTGDTRGRMLKARMNEKSLVNRESEFYDFSPRVGAHLILFVRYMTSRLQGTTQTLDRPEIRSSIATYIESYTIDHLEASGYIR